MAARIKIFLRKPPGHLTTSEIRKGIDAADWMTLGEHFDIGEDDAEAFIDDLKWQDDPLSFERKDQRPVLVELESDPEQVRELIDELSEFDGLSIPPRVRQHLDEVRAVVIIEMGFMELRTMFEIVAFEIAYWLAEKFDGLILSDADRWFDHTQNRWAPIDGQNAV